MSDWIVLAALGSAAVTGLLIWLLVRINSGSAGGRSERRGDDGAAYAPMGVHAGSGKAHDRDGDGDSGGDGGGGGGDGGGGGGGGD